MISFLLVFGLVSVVRAEPLQSKSNVDHSGGGGHAAGSAAQTQTTCKVDFECSEVLILPTKKLKEGTGIRKKVTKTGERTIPGGLFSKAKKEEYAYETTVWVPEEYVDDKPAGTALNHFTRSFQATALDTEGNSPQDVEKAALARLDRATKAITSAGPKQIGTFRHYRDDFYTQMSCRRKEGAVPSCETSKQSRQVTLNQMLEPQHWTGDVKPLLALRGYAYQAGHKYGDGTYEVDEKTDPRDLPVTADPFHLADTLLFREALKVKEALPVPDRMYCYYIVEKTRPVIEADVRQRQETAYGMSTSRYDRNFLFLMRQATSNVSFSHTTSSELSVHLNTQYKSSGALVLEDITEKGSYKNPLEMKQDSCNRAQERYLVANTFADVLVGCQCASQRILPSGRVSEYKIFEY